MGNYYFGLKKRPFIAEPVPEAYCAFGDMESARIQISRCVERQEGVALVSGLSGMGKTLLCRTLQKQFQDRMGSVLLNGKNLTHPHVFFETLLSRFRAPFVAGNLTSMRETLVSLLGTSKQFRGGLLLLIDDAQAAPAEVFEEIRQLLDLTNSPEPGVRVVLFGDTGLEEKLTFPQLESFSQRITLRCFLESLNRDETAAFLREELAQAGDTKGLFSRDVCREIFRFADGQPRLINQLADHVLVLAAELRGKSASAGVSELPEENGIFSSVDSDSVLEAGKFDDWESDSFAENSSVLKSSEEPASLEGNASENVLKNETASNAEDPVLPNVGADYSQPLEPEWITAELVQRAWRSLQQFGGNEDGPSGTVSRAEDDLDALDSVSAASVSSNSIEFGSLDDDLDSGSSIELGGEGPLEDSTQIWSYDEAQEVRDAIEEANALPHEWEISAQENALRNEQVEQGTERLEDSRNVRLEPDHERADLRKNGAVADGMETPSSVPFLERDACSVKEPLRECFQKEERNSQDDDWWDVLKESSSFSFPSRGESASPLPSYSSRTPVPDGYGNPQAASYGRTGMHAAHAGRPFQEEVPYRNENISASYSAYGNGMAFSSASANENFAGNASGKASPSTWTSPVSGTPSGFDGRGLSVDELILDAVMEDTVHAMGLLQRILAAMRDESRRNADLTQISDYWLELQEHVKGSIRRIAQERSHSVQKNRAPLFRSFAQNAGNRSCMSGFAGTEFGSRQNAAGAADRNWNFQQTASTSSISDPFHRILSERMDRSAGFQDSRFAAGEESGITPTASGISAELESFLAQAVLKALASGNGASVSAAPFREARAEGMGPANAVSGNAFAGKSSGVRIEPECGNGDFRSSVPPVDFYQPETLIENGVLRMRSGNFGSSGNAGTCPMDPVRNSELGENGEAVSSDPSDRAGREERISARSAEKGAEFSKMLENTELDEAQDLALLRSILQKCRTSDALDLETQERLFQIISQLQTLNLNS
ncbi:MAG: AAA family ATPase [Thermoguttaceae bacterium]|nr:AAA family ATPase [Thermoguttaceae bacterium]